MPTFMKNLNVTARCANQYRADKLADIGLSGCQHSYIINICRNPGISQEHLSKMLYINKSNVARQLSLLEENGFIYREQSPEDKRNMLVYPTEKAKNALPVVLGVLKDWSAYLSEGFTEEEISKFTEMMDKISEKAQAYIENKETNENTI
ncbi:MAG: MarR family winged helix-turn-helix transcriptional regulator [Clostridiales bacterium]|nr:MarR family winged helix-turn-helix transcriptional regulator [Clostridiales bacterium]